MGDHHAVNLPNGKMGRRAAGVAIAGAAAGLVGATAFTGRGTQAATAAGPSGAKLLSAESERVQVVAPSGDTSGATDSAAIADAIAGQVAQLLPGTYYIDKPVAISESGQALLGYAADGIDAGASTRIVLVSGFSGSAAIELTASSAEITGCQVRGITVDCSQVPPDNGVAGILGTGSVHGLVLTDVEIRSPGANGIGGASNSTGNPYTWRALRVQVSGAGNNGFSVGAFTDSTWTDCEAIAAASNGWNLSASAANSKFIGCRAEWCKSSGWSLNGAWGDGTGSGGHQLIGCSTDRNTGSGVDITATGTVPVMISGLTCRRDHAGSATSGAAVTIGSATVPVIVSDLVVFPGTNDDGSGNLSPAFGINAYGTNTYVSVVNAYLHAVSAGLDGSGPDYGMTRGRAVSTRTGSTSSPSGIIRVADWG